MGRSCRWAKISAQDNRNGIGHAELVFRNYRQDSTPARAIPHDHFHISSIEAADTGHGERTGIDPASWAAREDKMLSGHSYRSQCIRSGPSEHLRPNVSPGQRPVDRADVGPNNAKGGEVEIALWTPA